MRTRRGEAIFSVTQRPGQGQSMASVVNLNRFRKAKAQQVAEHRAAENRAAFGRSKAERRKQDSDRARSERTLDGKRIE